MANELAVHSGGKISDSQLGRASLASSDAGAEHGIGQHRGPSGAIAPVLSPKNRPAPGPIAPGKPRRFYGSVEIDMVRPVKSFDAILNAVVMELQRRRARKAKLTLEIEAEASVFTQPLSNAASWLRQELSSCMSFEAGWAQRSYQR